MVWGIDLGNGDMTREVIHESFARGLVVESAGSEDQVVKVLPPLTIEKDTLIEGLTRLRQAFDSVYGTVSPPVAAPIELPLSADVTPHAT